MEKLGINFKNLDNIALVNIKNDRTKESVKYKELLKEIIKTSLVIEEFEVPKESTIGILANKSFQLVALTLGILESDFPFCYISKDDARVDLIDFNSRYFFSEIQMNQSLFKLLKTITIFGKEIFFYKLDIVRNLRTFEDGGDKMFKLCYVIKTSGTSGRRKVVHVTFNSITPNITSLQRIFQLNCNDVILSVSPITFDPFMIDLFLSLSAGSSLLFIADSLRFDGSLFLRDSSESTGVTFLQTTPTLFQQYGIENIQTKILSDSSSLK
jgi:acyl-CoA synthetase